ncbi:hypothetical protein TNCV_64581 [Trichonephila clavipes]|nr:hypothetical protein TNCV_64581 [Trichonephila clavipes]
MFGHYVMNVPRRPLVTTCLKASDRGLRNSSRQRDTCTPVISRSFGHHSTIWLGSTPILREHPGDGQGSRLSSPSKKLTRGFEVRGLFRVILCRNGTVHSQTSMPSPGFEPRPYGTAVRWVVV